MNIVDLNILTNEFRKIDLLIFIMFILNWYDIIGILDLLKLYSPYI